MQLLAISFMLPPMLFPQAIQIGRLLEGSDLELATVSGSFADGQMGALGQGFSSGQRFLKRICLPHQAPLKGISHRLAMRLVPFYGRAPDEFLAWSEHAATITGAWLEVDRPKIDVMATFGEPMSDHLIGLTLKKRFGLPWLAHFSDPWVDNPFRKFQPLANWRNRKLESDVVEAADSVVFTSEETRQLVMEKYPANWARKAFVLPHSFNPADFSGAAPVKQARSVVVRYLGNFYGHRTPFPLFSSLSRLLASRPEALEDVRVELVGSMSAWMRMHPAIKKFPKGLLTFCGSVPYQRSLDLMKESDLLLVIDAPATHSVFLPSKLVDYIGAGVPIFGIVPPGASQKLITRLGGATADPTAPDSIDHGLLEAINAARAAKHLTIAWGASEVRQEFEVDRVATSFRSILEWTAGRGPA